MHAFMPTYLYAYMHSLLLSTYSSPPKQTNGKAAVIAAYNGKAKITSDHHYDSVEKEFKDLLGNPKRKADLDALWSQLDFNNNHIVSLAEIDRLMVSV